MTNPDYMKKLMAKANALQWDDVVETPVVARDQENTVKHDAFDEIACGVLHDHVPGIGKAVRRLSEEFDYVRPAYEDLFYILFQGDPLFNEKAAMLDGYEQNLPLMKYVRGQDEVNDLRQGHTIFDEYGTAFAMLGLEDTMRDAFRRTKDAREAVQAAKEFLEQMKDRLNEIRCGGFPVPDDGTGQPGIAMGPAHPHDVANAFDDAQNAQSALDKAEADLDEISKAAAQDIAEAAQDIGNELDRQKSLTNSYGVQDGVLKRMPFEERRELVDKLDTGKMELLADLCGPMREYGDATRRRPIKHVPGAQYDIKAGNDLSKLLMGELVNLAHPDLEELFLLRWAEHSLMVAEERGIEKAGQGPILVVCDESSSMGQDVDDKGRSREIWSKAVTLALCDQAKRQKRDFSYIGFSSANQQWQIDFPGGDADIDGIVEFATHFFKGGTSYVQPLDMAKAAVLAAEAAGRVKPDIVFITDDECRLTDEYIEEWAAIRKRLNMCVWGVQIGGKGKSVMHRVCDRVIQLTNLTAGPEGMKDLFQQI